MLSQVLTFSWYNKTIPGIFSYMFKVFRHILLRWLCCFVLDGVCQRSLPRMILFTRSSMEQTLQPARNWAVTWRVSLVSVKEKPPWGHSPQCPLDTELREEPLWLLQPLGMGRVSTEMSPASQSHGERRHCAQGRDLGRGRSSLSWH